MFMSDQMDPTIHFVALQEDIDYIEFLIWTEGQFNDNLPALCHSSKMITQVVAFTP